MQTELLMKSPGEARELSYELRQESGADLERRRKIVGLSMISIGCMGLISLYQMGMIRHLPEPPLPLLDADKVDAAPDAYRTLSAPDASLGLASYAVTLALASMEGPDRARTHPWLPLLMTGKIVADTLRRASSRSTSGPNTGPSASGVWPPPVRPLPPFRWHWATLAVPSAICARMTEESRSVSPQPERSAGPSAPPLTDPLHESAPVRPGR